MTNGKLVRTLDFPHRFVSALAIHGKTLAAGSTDGKIVLFDLDSGQPTLEFSSG